MNKIPTLGVGMAGFGFIGKVHSHAHLSVPLLYDPLPCRTKLVGVCTATAASGEKAKSQAGFEFDTRQFDDLLSRDDIHIIHICTPNDCHYEMVRDALHAGKHIYCDKPLALNTQQAQYLADLAAMSIGWQQMTFNYRFVPAVMRARELTQSGYLGELFSFRAAYLHAGYVDPNRPFSWRTDFARSGGGAIADLGAHVIDLIRYTIGNGANVTRAGEFSSLSAVLQTLITQRKDAKSGSMRPVDVDDIAFATCIMEGGAAGTLEASRLATGVQDELRLELHGSKGGLRFNLMEANWLDAYDNTQPETSLGGNRGFRRIECVTRYPKPYALGATKNTIGWLNFHISSVFDFLTNIISYQVGRDGSPLSPTFRDGLAAQKVISACQNSSRLDGKIVEV